MARGESDCEKRQMWHGASGMDLEVERTGAVRNDGAKNSMLTRTALRLMSVRDTISFVN